MKLSEASRCTRCNIRWRQSKLGLCRKCEKALGIEAEGALERERQRVEKQAARMAALAPRLTPAPGGRQHVELDKTPFGGTPGLAYIVVWHGGMDGAPAMGLPMAQEKGSRLDYTRGEDFFPGQRKGAGLRRAGAFERD